MNSGLFPHIYLMCQHGLVLLLVFTFCFIDLQYFFSIGPNFIAKTAFAAESSITGTANTGSAGHMLSGASTVFISDQVGYKFFQTGFAGNIGRCAYRKTTNGGASWGADVNFDNQTDCTSPVVWYDRWTSGDTGTYIHIVNFDTASTRDALWYNRLDTSSDTLLMGTAPVNISSSSGKLGTLTSGSNKPSLTKGTDGTIYAAISDNSNSYVIECSSNCNLQSSWVNTGTSPLSNVDNDFNVMVPLSGGDIMLINRSNGADTIRSKIWNNSAWDVGWNNLTTTAVENTTYDVAMSAVYNPVTSNVYIAYIADNDTFTVADHDIRTGVYSGGSWTATANVLTNTAGALTNLALGINENNNDVYVAYSRRTTIGTAGTANIYWASSTAAMSSWSAIQGPVNASADDIYGVDLNYSSNQRLYVSWYEAGPDDFFGDTILDTSPATIVSASGTQSSVTRSDVTNVYVGGKFVVQEFLASRNVSSVTITENGTVAANSALSNIRLLYDIDTTAPYDCSSESYSGSESQFGSTDSNGFSGADGVSAFTDTVSISLTQSLCLYPVFDVLASGQDGSTIEVSIQNPPADVVVSGGVTANPASAVALSGTTNVVSAPLRLAHYHWRNDNGSESGATSATAGSENTPLSSLSLNTPIRLRLGINNEGSTTTIGSQLQLEFATAAPTCVAASSWTAVGASNDEFAMYDSSNLTHNGDTTNIVVGSGGVSNADTNFLTPNNGVRDTSDSSAIFALDFDEYVELEYSLTASTSAIQGQTYCFRVTQMGVPIATYDQYPAATIAANVAVSSLGSHIASAEIPEVDVYLGGSFVMTELGSTRDVTSITITENGTIDGAVDLQNIKLFYDLDTSAPYNCASESYGGSEPQFGSTDSNGFSSAQGSSTFTGTVSISPTQTLCVYTVVDIQSSAQSGETISIRIGNPAIDVAVSAGGSISPSTPVAISGSTEVSGAIVAQSGYHWRNDDGTENSATSATGGSDDVALLDFAKSTPIRLRVGLDNTGGTSSAPYRYNLQFGIKVTTCENISSWTNVDAFSNDSFDMVDSSNLTHGSDTTNIAIGSGGVVDGSGTFLTPNSGVRETESASATTTLASNQYVDLEFSLTSTAVTPYETDFCFRLTEGASPLVSYAQYAELTTTEKRDFKIQRGSRSLSGVGGTTLVAGVDYEAPASTSTAFVRITNTSQTGAGHTVGGGNQNVDDVSVYITNATNLLTSFTLTRDTDSINQTRVDWEIIEFIGDPGTDNEIIVRNVNTFSLASAVSATSSPVIPGIVNDNDVVVFVTGVLGTAGNRTTYPAIQFTTNWSSSTNQATFTRQANNDVVRVSYAVVEFVGQNWKIQRAEHNYTVDGSYEVENITAVNSINRTFLYSQKRMAANTDVADFGHLVFLSGIGTVSFFLEPLTVTPANHTSVVWVIENTQTGPGEMVSYQSSGLTSGGAEPSAFSISGWGSVNDVSNASIWGVSASDQTLTSFPRPMSGFTITSTSTYQVWRSDTGSVLDYRAEIVQWPAADVALRQNYYRFYYDDGNLTSLDPWPLGVTDLGENTSITALDSPLADGERVRMRMSVQISNGTLVANLQSLKLQYGQRATTCSAISTWNDVGAIGSGAIWRGYDIAGLTDGDALSVNPPTGGDLLLSVSDRAGTLEEENNSNVNPYDVQSGEDVEYDFVVEHNGATQRTNYCFRLVQSNNMPLAEYFNYPQLRTNGYAPATEAWRWYDDESSDTPTAALSGESVSPVEVQKGNSIKLRVTVDETNNLGQNNARFKLQFSDNPSFTNPQDVVATSSCTLSSIWCYGNGGGFDNATITASVLSTSDLCIAGSGPGCGVYNESPLPLTGFRHNAYTAQEYDFTIEYQPVSGYYGQVWYFRLYDVINDLEVPVNTGYTRPSLVGESGTLNFTIAGLPAATTTEGVALDVSSNSAEVPFGTIEPNIAYTAGHRLTVETNAIFGYAIYKYARAQLSTDVGATITPVSGSNATPASWSVGCTASSSCFGYHAGDDTLDGVAARFAANDSYAGFDTEPQTIMFNSSPTTDSSDIIYRLKVNQLQAPGDYATDVVYIAVPIF